MTTNTTKNITKTKKTTTTTTVKNGISYEENGWKYISIRGEPHERGYAYGYLCANEFKKIQEMLLFFIPETYGMSWEYFVQEINRDFKEMTKHDFHEFFVEMQGIADGLQAGGTPSSLDEIIAWNFYMSIPYWFSTRSENHVGKEGGGVRSKDKCSAFIAVGNDWTEDGKIVVAHNSFSDFIDGQWSKVILHIHPSKGHRILMQTTPGWIWSGSDFFVTSMGIIGTETTIGGFSVYEKNVPVGYRIRKAMQYGNSLEDYVEMLLKGNSGDYANSWLFGDTETNEILRIELGLKYHNVERTKNGYFIGFNAPYDPQIRNLECNNSGFYDIRRHQGARRVRLTELMEENKGKLNLEIAQKMIADHYDIYLHKTDHPCSRTVCSHYDLDAREYMSQADRPKPFSLHGAVDGAVVDSSLAKQMKIRMRFGNSCGTPFVADDFFKKHIQWRNFQPYIFDRLTQPWTTFGEEDHSGKEMEVGGGRRLRKTIETHKRKHRKNMIKRFRVKTFKLRK